MSLQVWLPLNGNLNNQGLVGHISASTTNITYTTGKLGQCLSRGSCYMTAEQTTRVLNNKEFSLCFWVYVNADTGTSTSALFFGNGAVQDNDNRKFSIFQYPTVNDIHYYWQNDSASNFFAGGTVSGVMPSYAWTHVAVTYKNPTGTIYINGNKVKTFSGVSNSAMFAYQTSLFVDSSYRYLSDYRVYSNCLSAKEVNEIAKGLILHYKLGGTGGDNLIQGSYNYAKSWSIHSDFTKSTDPNDGSTILSFSRTGSTGPSWCRAYSNGISKSDIFESGITVSFEFKCDSSIPLTDTCIVALQTFNGSGTRLAWYEPRPTLTFNYGEWTKYSVYWPKSVLSILNGGVSTNTDDIVYFLVSWQLVRDGSIHFKKMKIEKGNKATPWCPNRADVEYTTLGYNDGIEYDCSGFGNNGTKVGTIICDNNTVRYDGSYDFNNTGYIKNPSFNINATEMTISFWVKIPASTTNQHFLFGTFDNFTVNGIGYWRDKNATYYEGLIKSNAESSYVGLKTPALTAETWYHVAIVYTGTICILYINGIENKRVTYGSNGKIINPVCYVGNSMYTGTPSSETDESNMVDFRIYATALSADDIKALYTNTISIDSNGTIHAYDFKEE